MTIITSDMSQVDTILRHFWEHGRISKLQAIREHGVLNLGDVVYKLRRKGHAIETRWRHQKGKRYAVYYYTRPSRDDQLRAAVSGAGAR